MLALEQLLDRAVIASLLKTWLNGWCASHRFRDEGSTCKLMCDCDGQDDLEHYALCLHGKHYLGRRLLIDMESATLQSFMLLDAELPLPVPLMATHLHAV